MRRQWFVSILIVLSACGGTTQPTVEIARARSPAPPPGANVAAVYAELKATHDDKLLHAQTPIAEKVEIHSTRQENGMMQMRPTSTVELPAGTSVSFAPGALHLMLVGLQAPLAAHSRFPMTFHFENAGDVSIEVAVVAPGEMQH